WARWGYPAAGALAACAVLAFAAAAWTAGLAPTRHAFDATVWVLILWLAAHFGAGLVMLGYCSARSFAGRMTPKYDADSANVLLYWHFMYATVAVVFALLALFPFLIGDAP
ncbi:MAG TPA: cytochrome ubiquinol oxidase subunit I, partial [Thermohalobaculum sp.]|nr:cytochrome ubiquinol oxidase subunit I [Thermohalobaculum sp.]